MKTIVTQEGFKAAIARAAVAVAGKPTLPVLANLLLRADQGRLTLTATDLELGISTWVEAQVLEAGAITLPAKLLADVVGSLPNAPITLTTESRAQSAKLMCGTSTSTIKGIEADDFPSLPTLHDGDTIATIAARTLGAMLDQVAPCAAADDTRPVLAGVLLRLRDGALTLAAADGFRLARHSLPLPTIMQPDEHLLQAKALTKLGKVLGADGEVQIRASRGGSHVAFVSPIAQVIARQIDGKFPDFERIIPKAFHTRSVLDRVELAKAVTLASYFARSSQNVVKLTLTPGGDDCAGRVQISANAAELGDNAGELEGLIAGAGGPIALNVHYLADALAMIDTAQVAIETQTPQAPAVLKPVGADAYIHIIMPMSLR